MDRVVQSNAAAAEEGSAAAEELNAQASAMLMTVEELKALVGIRGDRPTTQGADARGKATKSRRNESRARTGVRAKGPSPVVLRAAKPRAAAADGGARVAQFAEI